MCLLVGKDLRGILVTAGIGDLMGADGNLASLTHSYTHISTRNLNLHLGIRGNRGLNHRLILVMLRLSQRREELVAIVAEVGTQRTPEVVPAGRTDAKDSQQNHQAAVATEVAGAGRVTPQIQRPLAQRYESDAD